MSNNKKQNAAITAVILIRNIAVTIAAVVAVVVMLSIFFRDGDNPKQKQSKKNKETLQKNIAQEEKNKPKQDVKNKPNTAKYNFSKELQKRDKEVQDTVKRKIETNNLTTSQRKGQNYRIQIGSFKDRDNADRLRAKMILRDYPVQMAETRTDEGNMFVVQIGPYYSQSEAIRIKGKLEKEGIKDPKIKNYRN